MLAKRDMKKSYYVWFLGAQEARTARGTRHALAALARLERRAHDLDPFKVTLQVSPKGLKIIQNVDGRGKGGRGRAHTVKHFLPADSVTEVVARGDAVVCILLLYNPVTRCPLHAHAYRCDSEQTAQALSSQLRTIAGLGPEEDEEEDPIQSQDSPEPIEPHTQQHETRLAPEQEVAAERLAAELRRRLAGREPLLLPPRDYDTMRKGPPGPVQPNARRNGKGVLGSSAGSSGIGSDLAPSPDRPHTSSEEDWTESTAYMLHDAYEARRQRSPSPVKQKNRTSSSIDRSLPRSNGQEHSVGSVSPKDRFNVAKEKFMNLEREKTDVAEKRALMRQNLDNILSKGPKTPLELQNFRSNPKWPSDEEDTSLEHRPEMPRIVPRNDGRDQRNYRESREDYRIQRDYRDGRYPHESRDYRDMRNNKEPLNMRELKEPLKDVRGYRDYHDNDMRGHSEHKESKIQKDNRYSRERDYKDREYHEPRDYKDSKEMKYLREYREVDDIRNLKLNNETHDVRHSRERTPQLEQRYFEYRGGGERSDKYFDNRYKQQHQHQESRSDDEGVESEKQFEEIRYVPHRRDPDPRMVKMEPVKRDGRIELLEERQRQMESKRVMRPPEVEDRYDRSLEIQRRPHVDNRDWDILRRSYAEAERPRRDGRARHSYAEPVARTRVGMATVAPF